MLTRLNVDDAVGMQSEYSTHSFGTKWFNSDSRRTSSTIHHNGFLYPSEQVTVLRKVG
jgi:hypothetical protein